MDWIIKNLIHDHPYRTTLSNPLIFSFSSSCSSNIYCGMISTVQTHLASPMPCSTFSFLLESMTGIMFSRSCWTLFVRCKYLVLRFIQLSFFLLLHWFLSLVSLSSSKLMKKDFVPLLSPYLEHNKKSLQKFITSFLSDTKFYFN